MIRRLDLSREGSAGRGAPLLFLFAACWLILLAPFAGRAGEGGAGPETLPAGLDAMRVRQRAATRPATPDLVASVWKCPRCGALNSAHRLLPEQPPFDRLADVREVLLRVGLGRGKGWAAPAPDGPCAHCSAPAPAAPAFGEAILFRYFPETGCDAVARLGAGGEPGKEGDVLWGRLDVSGAYDAVGRLTTERLFGDAFGRVLSVREAWAEVAGESIAKSAPVVVKAGPGYFLTCRRVGADRSEDDRLAAELGVLVGKASGAGAARRQAVRLTEADRSELGKSIPTYRQWLPGQWRQLAQGRFVAEAVMAPAGLRRLAERELAPLGLAVDDRMLSRGEYRASFDMAEAERLAVQAGLSIGEGLHQFVWPQAARLRAIAEIGDRARAALRAYDASLTGGAVLDIREKPAQGGAPGSGAEVARLNLAALVGEVNLSAPGSVEWALSGLLGLDPATGRISPPKATDRRCSCGQEAWLARKPRPKDFFMHLGAQVATVEWRGLDLAWSLDCPDHARFLPAAGLPPEKELEARYARDVERAVFQVVAAKGVTIDKAQARLAIGPDISAAMADARLRRGLVRRLKADLPGRDMLFWAPTANIVVVSPAPIEGQARKELREGALELARKAGVPPGEDIDLEIRDRLSADPAGTFSEPPRPTPTNPTP